MADGPGEMDDSYEVLDIRGTAGGDDHLNQIIDALKRSMEKYPVTSKTALGVTGGYIAGLAVRKIGRTAASAIGGGLLILQMGYRAGYITINTSRVNRDARNFERRMHEEMRRNRTSISSISSQVQTFVRRNVPGMVGFGAGFLFGLAT